MDVKRFVAMATDGKNLKMYDHNRFKRDTALKCAEETMDGATLTVCRNTCGHLFCGHVIFSMLSRAVQLSQTARR